MISNDVGSTVPEAVTGLWVCGICGDTSSRDRAIKSCWHTYDLTRITDWPQVTRDGTRICSWCATAIETHVLRMMFLVHKHGRSAALGVRDESMRLFEEAQDSGDKADTIGHERERAVLAKLAERLDDETLSRILRDIERRRSEAAGENHRENQEDES